MLPSATARPPLMAHLGAAAVDGVTGRTTRGGAFLVTNVTRAGSSSFTSRHAAAEGGRQSLQRNCRRSGPDQNSFSSAKHSNVPLRGSAGRPKAVWSLCVIDRRSSSSLPIRARVGEFPRWEAAGQWHFSGPRRRDLQSRDRDRPPTTAAGTRGRAFQRLRPSRGQPCLPGTCRRRACCSSLTGRCSGPGGS